MYTVDEVVELSSEIGMTVWNNDVLVLLTKPTEMTYFDEKNGAKKQYLECYFVVLKDFIIETRRSDQKAVFQPQGVAYFPIDFLERFNMKSKQGFILAFPVEVEFFG